MGALFSKIFNRQHDVKKSITSCNEEVDDINENFREQDNDTSVEENITSTKADLSSIVCNEVIIENPYLTPGDNFNFNSQMPEVMKNNDNVKEQEYDTPVEEKVICTEEIFLNTITSNERVNEPKNDEEYITSTEAALSSIVCNEAVIKNPFLTPIDNFKFNSQMSEVMKNNCNVKEQESDTPAQEKVISTEIDLNSITSNERVDEPKHDEIEKQMMSLTDLNSITYNEKVVERENEIRSLTKELTDDENDTFVEEKITCGEEIDLNSIIDEAENENLEKQIIHLTKEFSTNFKGYFVLTDDDTDTFVEQEVSQSDVVKPDSITCNAKVDNPEDNSFDTQIKSLVEAFKIKCQVIDVAQENDRSVKEEKTCEEKIEDHEKLDEPENKKRMFANNENVQDHESDRSKEGKATCVEDIKLNEKSDELENEDKKPITSSAEDFNINGQPNVVMAEENSTSNTSVEEKVPYPEKIKQDSTTCNQEVMSSMQSE